MKTLKKNDVVRDHDLNFWIVERVEGRKVYVYDAEQPFDASSLTGPFNIYE